MFIITLKESSSLKSYQNVLDQVLTILDNEDQFLSNIGQYFTAYLNDKTAMELNNHPLVEYIEEDSKIYLQRKLYKEDKNRNYIMKNPYEIESEPESIYNGRFLIQNSADWGLSKIVESKNSEYEYFENGGEDVNIYVLDTGIDLGHSEFKNDDKRTVSYGGNFTDEPDQDKNGHGTHIAGIIGGSSTGIARSANMISVKIINKNGEGKASSFLKALHYVINEHNSIIKKTGKIPKTILNASVAGEKSYAINHAIRKAANTYKIHIAVAAGNSRTDSCTFSPGSADLAVTVGAIDEEDKIAKFSNTGNCVDIYAPGVLIKSAYPLKINNSKSVISNLFSNIRLLFHYFTGNSESYQVLSGTSMATPHVTGVLAVYLSLTDFTPEELKLQILEDSRQITTKHGNFSIISLKKLYKRLKKI
ncbi:psp3 [Nucleospora cyclopteri]